MRAILLGVLATTALSACTMKEQRLELLCTKVTLTRYLDLQKAHEKSFGKYAASLDQLQQDPPVECRESFFYDMKMAGDAKAFELRVERKPEGKVWTLDQTGRFTEPQP